MDRANKILELLGNAVLLAVGLIMLQIALGLRDIITWTGAAQ